MSDTCIESVVSQQASHLESIEHGIEQVISAAIGCDEYFAQGDLNIGPVEHVPNGYVKAKKKSVQLVPGNTIGSRHCLDHLDGVEMWLPNEWNEESLDGPVLKFSKPNRITHPTHGDLIFDEQFVKAEITIHCTYQRNYDEQEKRERRAAD